MTENSRKAALGIATALALAVVVACGSELATDELRDSAEDGEEAVVELLGGEWTVAPGEEKMICLHHEWEGEDLAVADLRTVQGEGGHHAVIGTTGNPRPIGTVRDCTDMAEFTPFLFDGPDLPVGHATYLPRGKHLLLQSHYVNSSDRPIRVRDTFLLKTIPIDDVEVWVSLLVAASTDLKIPAGAEGQKMFDCVLPRDMRLLHAGAHMHEHGASFEFLHGNDIDSLETILAVDPWKPEFRHVAPLEPMSEKPRELKAGDILRTVCRWNNPLDEDLFFPAEMCAAFGIVAGSRTAFLCVDGAGQ